MILSARTNQFPKLIQWGISFTILGVLFPIYGTPAHFMGLPRITIFRFGLILLGAGIFYYRVSLISVIRQKPVIFLFFLFFLRLFSLIILTPSETFRDAVVQLSWYFQGVLCLVFLLAVVRRWFGTISFIYKKTIFFGVIAASCTAFQYFVYYIFNIRFALPLSMTSLGIEGGLYGGGWYPLGPGGRILGPYFDPNMTGSVMAFLFCIMLPYISLRPTMKECKYVLFISLAVLGVVVSGSRQSLVITLAVTLLHVLILSGSKQWSLRLPYRMFVIVATSALLIYSYVYIMSLSLKVAQRGYEGGSVYRLKQGLQHGGMTETRFDSAKQMLTSLGTDIWILGHGEGTGWWSSHNAYVITLYETGVWALIILCLAILLMFTKALKNVNNSIKRKENDTLARAGPLIVVSWALMLLMNWAQLNQAFSWIFLTIAIMPIIKRAGSNRAVETTLVASK